MALLTLDTVCQFVQEQLVDAALKLGESLTAEEITGGNLNFSYVVRDELGQAVFVKQAPDFIKVIGPAAKLSRERMRLEVQVYQEWLAGGDMAAYIPRIWKFDEEHMAFIMDFLGSFQLLQRSLFEGDAQQPLASSLGRCLALMHSRTHSSQLSAVEAQRLAASYENRVLRDIQLEYVFSKCYREDPRAAHLLGDASFMSEVEALKAIYNGEDHTNLALCHGDLHAGSVMVDAGSCQVKIIDPEFAIFGPCGLDVGSLLSTYVLAYCFHSAQGRPCHQLLSSLQEIWASYLGAMGVVPPDLLKRIEVDALGFLGCEVVRTALGLAFERSLRIEDRELKESAERRAMELGVTCIRHRAGGMSSLTAAIATFDSG